MRAQRKAGGAVRTVLVGLGIAGILLGAAGCRQPIGEVPVPAGEQPNKIEDVGRDLQNVATGAPDAEADLREDLASLDSTPRPAELVDELAAALAAALAGTDPEVAEAEAVAQALFVVLTARDLSGAQVDEEAAGLGAALVAAGGDPMAADRAAAVAIALQAEITLNPRRWYHLF